MDLNPSRFRPEEPRPMNTLHGLDISPPMLGDAVRVIFCPYDTAALTTLSMGKLIIYVNSEKRLERDNAPYRSAQILARRYGVEVE